MLDLFVSHSHKDEVRSKALVKKLQGWGMSVYVDFEDTSLGQLTDIGLADRLMEKLRTCHLLVFAFSEEAAASKWMPWELGLAHGVIGRVVLWPFTKRALHARQTQEYLNLYECLDPETAQERLLKLVAEARASSIRPAHVRAMQDLGVVSAAKLPEFNNPAVAAEFVTAGPLQLYSAWLESISKAWRK